MKNDGFNEDVTKKIVIIFFFMTIFFQGFFIIGIFFPFFLIIGILSYIFFKRYYKAKNKVKVKFDYKYFREDLQKLPPSYISYIMDFDIEFEKDIAAHILKLYIDGYIVDKGKSMVVADKDYSNLNGSDKYLLDYVKDKHFFLNNPFFVNGYKRTITNELLEQGYIENKEKNINIIGIFITIFVVLFLISFIPFFLPFFSNNIAMIFKVIRVVVLILSGIAMIPLIPILVAKFIASNKYNKYKRTKKGTELLGQIYGLKNFLKDFSNIKNKKLEDVYLQEHYLVYALVFNINTTVDDEVLKRIKREIK